MEEQLKIEEFNKLEKRIWKTYHSRIITAKRLYIYSILLDFYSTIYTICLTLLSVFTLINGDKLINYFSVFISIIVMGFVFFGNSMNFKDRYINMKNNYLKLSDLYYKSLIKRINKDYNIESIYKDYNSLLNTVENHSTFDYMSYKLQDEEEKNKVTFIEKIKLCFRKIVVVSILLIILIIPIIFVIISFIKLFK